MSTMTARERVAATGRMVPPYLYEVVWNIALHGPLTAQEIADDHNRPVRPSYVEDWTPQTAANRMRMLMRLGLVERDDEGFYLLTDFGRHWVTTGGPG